MDAEGTTSSVDSANQQTFINEIEEQVYSTIGLDTSQTVNGSQDAVDNEEVETKKNTRMFSDYAILAIVAAIAGYSSLELTMLEGEHCCGPYELLYWLTIACLPFAILTTFCGLFSLERVFSRVAPIVNHLLSIIIITVASVSIFSSFKIFSSPCGPGKAIPSRENCSNLTARTIFMDETTHVGPRAIFYLNVFTSTLYMFIFFIFLNSTRRDPTGNNRM